MSAEAPAVRQCVFVFAPLSDLPPRLPVGARLGFADLGAERAADRIQPHLADGRTDARRLDLDLDDVAHCRARPYASA